MKDSGWPKNKPVVVSIYQQIILKHANKAICSFFSQIWM